MLSAYRKYWDNMQDKFRDSLSDLLNTWHATWGNNLWHLRPLWLSQTGTEGCSIQGWSGLLLVGDVFLSDRVLGKQQSCRLSKTSASERSLDSKRAVLCSVALITNAKGLRDLKYVGVHSRNLEDFFKMPEDVRLVWLWSRRKSSFAFQV